MKTQSLSTRIQRFAWKAFLRIGHDFIWRADEWFQKQEGALVQPALDAQLFAESQLEISNGATVAPILPAHGVPTLEENNDSHDEEHEQDPRFEWAQFQGVGGNVEQGDSIYRAGKPAGRRRAGESAAIGSGSGRKARRSNRVDGGHTEIPRRKLTAAGFDARMSLQLAKTRPVM